MTIGSHGPRTSWVSFAKMPTRSGTGLPPPSRCDKKMSPKQWTLFARVIGASSRGPAGPSDRANQIVCVVNLSPHHAHSGWVQLDLAALGIDADRPFQMHDLLSGARFLWNGARNFVQLDPQRSPAHVFRVRRRMHREQDFDYFL